MTLHVFNPEHDLALADNQPHFIAPRAARQLRHDLGFLPALWAAQGDAVLVDDVATARAGILQAGISADVEWVTRASASRFIRTHSDCLTAISPWGWDLTLRQQLAACGIAETLLPSPKTLADIRAMSHRAWAARHLLGPLRTIGGTIGRSWQIHHAEEAVAALPSCRSIVLKAPWSSSGRGIRYVFEYEYGDVPQIAPPVANWIANIVRRQGSIMLEPFYEKVIDLGMEFRSDGNGCVDYLGLSLFDTLNGAYTGNMLGTEEDKQRVVSQYVAPHLLHDIQAAACRILAPMLHGIYAGPLGIDMMVVRQNDQYLLHPCVELNLRNTMGHVALSLSRHTDRNTGSMKIVYDGNYRVVFQERTNELEDRVTG